MNARACIRQTGGLPLGGADRSLPTDIVLHCLHFLPGEDIYYYARCSRACHVDALAAAATIPVLHLRASHPASCFFFTNAQRVQTLLLPEPTSRRFHAVLESLLRTLLVRNRASLTDLDMSAVGPFPDLFIMCRALRFLHVRTDGWEVEGLRAALKHAHLCRLEGLTVTAPRDGEVDIDSAVPALLFCPHLGTSLRQLRLSVPFDQSDVDKLAATARTGRLDALEELTLRLSGPFSPPDLWSAWGALAGLPRLRVLTMTRWQEEDEVISAVETARQWAFFTMLLAAARLAKATAAAAVAAAAAPGEEGKEEAERCQQDLDRTLSLLPVLPQLEDLHVSRRLLIPFRGPVLQSVGILHPSVLPAAALLWPTVEQVQVAGGEPSRFAVDWFQEACCRPWLRELGASLQAIKSAFINGTDPALVGQWLPRMPALDVLHVTVDEVLPALPQLLALLDALPAAVTRCTVLSEAIEKAPSSASSSAQPVAEAEAEAKAEGGRAGAASPRPATPAPCTAMPPSVRAEILRVCSLLTTLTSNCLSIARLSHPALQDLLPSCVSAIQSGLLVLSAHAKYLPASSSSSSSSAPPSATSPSTSAAAASSLSSSSSSTSLTPSPSALSARVDHSVTPAGSPPASLKAPISSSLTYLRLSNCKLTAREVAVVFARTPLLEVLADLCLADEKEAQSADEGWTSLSLPHLREASFDALPAPGLVLPLLLAAAPQLRRLHCSSSDGLVAALLHCRSDHLQTVCTLSGPDGLRPPGQAEVYVSLTPGVEGEDCSSSSSSSTVLPSVAAFTCSYSGALVYESRLSGEGEGETEDDSPPACTEAPTGAEPAVESDKSFFQPVHRLFLRLPALRRFCQFQRRA